MAHVIVIIISLSSDYRVNAHGGYFVDVRQTTRNGRQLMARQPATRAEVTAFIARLRAAQPAEADITWEIIDEVDARYTRPEHHEEG